MDDLVAWLRARINAQQFSRWHTDGCAVVERGLMDGSCTCDGKGRVLRDVESKRRVLARHHRYGDDHPSERLHADACAGCGWAGDPDWPVTEDINECPELLDMAFRYGYDEERAAHPEG